MLIVPVPGLVSALQADGEDAAPGSRGLVEQWWPKVGMHYPTHGSSSLGVSFSIPFFSPHTRPKCLINALPKANWMHSR